MLVGFRGPAWVGAALALPLLGLALGGLARLCGDSSLVRWMFWTSLIGATLAALVTASP